MTKIIQHVPGWVDTDVRKTSIFQSTKELLDIDFVYQWEFDEAFHQFSINKSSTQTLLMAEYNEGKKWWVVGRIEDLGDLQLDLPKWVKND